VKRVMGALMLAAIATLGVAAATSGGGITVAPFSFNAVGLGGGQPSAAPPAHASWQRDSSGNWYLDLEKKVNTPEVAAAGAQINGVKGLSTAGMVLSFKLLTIDSQPSYCGAGAPRFNVHLTDGTTVFLGCVYGNSSGTVTFTSGNTYGGVPFPADATVDSISIIQDETGHAFLDDISVNSMTAGAPGNSK
jgi:hypothetical protein